MHILYLNASAALGGAERVLLDVIASVRQADPAVTAHVVVPSTGPLVERARALGARVWVLSMPPAMLDLGESTLYGQGRMRASLGMTCRTDANGTRSVPTTIGRVRATLDLTCRTMAAGWATWRYVEQLRQLIAEVGPDVIHSNGIKFHLLVRLARWQQVPVLWHIHDFLGQRPFMSRALRWASASARKAIAVSQAVRRDFQNIVPSLPIETIHNAVDIGRFSPRPVDGRRLDELAHMPSATTGTVRIGLVATYARWKGQDIFLEAAARVRGRSTQPLRFYIVGGPIYQTRGSQFSRDELRTLAAGLNIDKHVGFIDFQPDPVEVYRALDVVVHAATRPEPFGLTIVEAMACARPVIVSQAGGAAELFTPGHDALGVPPADPSALAESIGQLVASPADRLRLAANARLSAVQRFDRDRLGPRFLDVYDRLLGRSHMLRPHPLRRPAA